MISSLMRNKFVLLIIVMVVVAGAWYGLSSSSAPASTGALTSAGVDTSGDSDIVNTLLSLQAITLSGTIFSDPAYPTLKDFTTAIVPVPAGRPNPFAPISTNVAASGAAKSAAIFKPAP
jgi:hypothetical protein